MCRKLMASLIGGCVTLDGAEKVTSPSLLFHGSDKRRCPNASFFYRYYFH